MREKKNKKNLIEWDKEKVNSYFLLWIGSCFHSCSEEKESIELTSCMSLIMKEIPNPT
jgi:hypothetical protein